jgi:hypothetical protein
MHANAKQIIGSAKSNYAQLKAAIEDFKAALPYAFPSIFDFEKTIFFPVIWPDFRFVL